MPVELELMPENVVVASRPPTSPLHEKLALIEADEDRHGKMLVLDKYPLPDGKGKAHTQKQNMTNFYGATSDVLGFTFVVTRAVDNSVEYLGVTFDPSRIVPGNFEKFQAVKKQKAEELKLKKAAKAEIKKLEEAEKKGGKK